MSPYIYHGPWINWSHGLIGGATITLGEREGGLLTAFIATFVTIVGAELWKAICYASHQFRSTDAPEDGLYHQQQVILRNTGGAAGTAWLFLQQAWCWYGRAKRSLLRTLPWALLSLTYVAAVGVTAVFSSQISKSPGSTRLLMSDDCGLWFTNTSAPKTQRLNAYNTKMANESVTAAAYAKACYGGSHDSLACSRYTVPSISWTANNNATCPFQPGMCLFGDTAAFQATSKLIDSHLDLGVNVPPSSRILLEKTTTCAPLHTKGFVEVVNASADPDGYGRDSDKIMKFYYGETLGLNNITYWYNDHASFDQFPYSLSVVQANAGPIDHVDGAFLPVPAINASNADVSMLFIASNFVRYQEACQDPVFSATDLVEDESTGIRFFNPDRYVNVVGCAEQYRVCNPVNGKCTEKLGVMQLQQTLVENDDNLQLNTLQNATAYRLVLALQVSSVYHQTYTRLGGALQASDTLQGFDQAYLPPTQWHNEVGSWFDTGLARLQQKTQEYATGPAFVPDGSFVLRPNVTLHLEDAPYKVMCYSQVVHDSSDSMSFSITGLAILLIVGAIIIFAGLAIDTIVGWLQVRLGKNLHKHTEWKVNDTLCLQKLLHEEMQLGNWDGSGKLPVTRSDEKFKGPADVQVGILLESRDRKHGSGEELHLVEENFDTKQDGPQ